MLGCSVERPPKMPFLAKALHFYPCLLERTQAQEGNRKIGSDRRRMMQKMKSYRENCQRRGMVEIAVAALKIG
ncbi:hypothetical protein RIF29_16941 [Crotalaria pallida]|uniref:Uncharacterized protein n=1 Tax=Crotalaria pallida TaxID=3830 RepID=A0AAN9FG82_CROPI